MPPRTDQLRVDPDVLKTMRLTPGFMSSDFPIHKIGIALSGGGTKGDFEVGVLRYLYDKVLAQKPFVVTGSSVGAINGANIAQGAPRSVEQLEAIWRDMRGVPDMYAPEGAFGTLDTDVRDVLSSALAGAGPNLPVLGPLGFVGIIAAAGFALDRIGDIVNRIRDTKGLYNFAPMRARIEPIADRWSPSGPGLRGANVAVDRDGRGSLVVIARAFDDTLWQRSQLEPNARATAGWSKWHSMGDGRVSCDPVMIHNADGSIRGVVARLADEKLYVKLCTSIDPNRPQWTSWEPLGHPPDKTEALKWNPPSTYQDRPGIDVIVAVDEYGHPYHKSWDELRRRWTDWLPFGTVTHPSPLFGKIFVEKHANGRLLAVTRGTRQGAYYCEGMGAWTRDPRALITSDPVIVSKNGLLMIFALGSDSVLYIKSQLRADSPYNVEDMSQWTEWEHRGGIITSNLAVTRNLDSRLEVIVRGNSNDLWTKWQTGDSVWNEGYGPLGQPQGVYFVADPVAAINADGRIEVFAVGNDLALWHKYQTAPSNGWSDWMSLGGNLWSGIQLRLAMVSLETGDLEHVTESGQFVDRHNRSGQCVGLTDAILASSSIPVVNPPVPLDGENFVDGGCRSITPVQAAIEAGADTVFAIVASPPTLEDLHPLLGRNDILDVVLGRAGTPGAISNYETAGVFDIAQRAVMDILPHSITENELAPPNGWGKNVVVIRPTVHTHDTMTMEPGLIRISMDYGYMRGYDDVDSEANGRYDVARETSDRITSLRVTLFWKEVQIREDIIWLADERFIPRHRKLEFLAVRNSGNIGPFQADRSMRPVPASLAAELMRRVEECRELKCQVKTAVELRRQRGCAMPSNPDDWWRNWEHHDRPVTAFPSNPWGVWEFHGASIAAVDPAVWCQNR
jgi:predicted acylesterase/phospholipase RssA